MNKNNVLDFLKDNKDFLSNEFRLKKLGLFGSFSRGDFDSDSDIDIGIEFENDVESVRYLKESLRKFLSNNLSRNIDLCNLKYLRPYAEKHILKDIIYV